MSAPRAASRREEGIRRLAHGNSVVMVHRNPAAGTASTPASADEPEPAEAESVLGDEVEDPPMDREAFRLATLGLPPPTREDILIGLADPDQVTPPPRLK